MSPVYATVSRRDSLSYIKHSFAKQRREKKSIVNITTWQILRSLHFTVCLYLCEKGYTLLFSTSYLLCSAYKNRKNYHVYAPLILGYIATIIASEIKIKIILNSTICCFSFALMTQMIFFIR